MDVWSGYNPPKNQPEYVQSWQQTRQNRAVWVSGQGLKQIKPNGRQKPEHWTVTPTSS